MGPAVRPAVLLPCCLNTLTVARLQFECVPLGRLGPRPAAHASGPPLPGDRQLSDRWANRLCGGNR